MVRAVFDTNILVSGLLYLGKPKRIIDLALAGRIDVVSSKEMVAEFKDVISRDKFGFSAAEQRILTSFVVGISHVVTVRSSFKAVHADPDDDKVLRTAFDGKAAYVVSGDHHLLDMGKFRGIRIVTAAEMLDIVQ